MVYEIISEILISATSDECPRELLHAHQFVTPGHTMDPNAFISLLTTHTASIIGTNHEEI